MASEPEVWEYTASDAAEAAQVVVDHKPSTPRTQAVVPADHHAAVAGVENLAARLRGLPPSIRSALEGAERSAAHLSDDRLQGLAELVQNADDLGAGTAAFFVDEPGSRLLFRHDGQGLTLYDVWGLAIPWLSLKVADADQLGRFGIGLKTLQSLSNVLEVHEGHFHVRFEGQEISATEPIDDRRSAIGETTFVVPFDAGVVEPSDVAAWLDNWGDAGLVFLRNLHTVVLVDSMDAVVTRLHVDRHEPEQIRSRQGEVTRRRVCAADGKAWMTYSRNVATPAGSWRAGKAQAGHTTVGAAFPQFEGDSGALHVGLPVRRIRLPFRVSAQFDPLANRRDISDTEWNHALVAPLTDVWRDAVLDQFTLEPSRAWSFVPLTAEFDADDRTTGKLRAAFETGLMSKGRIALAEELTLPDGGAAHRLADLAYEAPRLMNVLEPADVRLVSGKVGIIGSDARSPDDRWRRVLADFDAVGAETPAVVEVEDALQLLNGDGRRVEFLADLLAVAVEVGVADRVEGICCLALDGDRRAARAEVTGLNVLLPAGAGPLWDTLGMGSRLHDLYQTRVGWPTVRAWLWGAGSLRKEASDRDALEVLATAGEKGEEFAAPLTDPQVEALRGAVEDLPTGERDRLGAGIGYAVRLAATSYDAQGNLVAAHARPSEAYIIEREAQSWRVAAGKTPGLMWLHRRYSEILKPGNPRDGVGAQKLFRLLGAETAPRLVEHPDRERKYQRSATEGVRLDAGGSPPRRAEQMLQHAATYTLDDHVSPDLDAVLAGIRAEKKRGDRMRRAAALLNALNKAWDRLEPHAHASAVVADYAWVPRGQVDAWWLASAASAAWLLAADGRLRPPANLRIKTDATVALFGDDRALYLTDEIDPAAFPDVLPALGVQGDPRPEELLSRLQDVQEETVDDPRRAGDLASPLYVALASQITGHGRPGRVGTMPAAAVRSAFNSGLGLVATNIGWRRSPVVFTGPPVFGEFHAFVPSVIGADRLWELLAIRKPNHDDAVEILKLLHRRKSPTTSDAMVMLDALRILAATPVEKLPRLRRSAVWIGDRWTTNRPVYAVANPIIVDGLTGTVPIWSPGGSLMQLDTLIEPYGLTKLTAGDVRVHSSHRSTYDPTLTQTLSDAVANLREDLALSDPDAERSLTIPWDDLGRFRVCILPDLTVGLTEPTSGIELSFTPRAWLEVSAETLYVVDGAEAGRPESGAYAIASVFAGDARRISHDWVAAWACAEAGFRAGSVISAAGRDADEKLRRATTVATQLRTLAARPKRQPAKQTQTAVMPGDDRAAVTEGERRPLPPRQLVDVDALTLRNVDGDIVANGVTRWPAGAAEHSPGTQGVLRDPDPARPKQPLVGVGRPRQNYTAEELETRGLDLAKWVLGLDDEHVVDIRNQHHVGADAVDDLQNFYELKVYSGSIPDEVRLEDSQVQRALSTKDFFLVVVGNVEEDQGAPEIRIITDPLHQLHVRPAGSVRMGGVLSAQALRYTFEKETR